MPLKSSGNEPHLWIYNLIASTDGCLHGQVTKIKQQTLTENNLTLKYLIFCRLSGGNRVNTIHLVYVNFYLVTFYVSSFGCIIYMILWTVGLKYYWMFVFGKDKQNMFRSELSGVKVISANALLQWNVPKCILNNKKKHWKSWMLTRIPENQFCRCKYDFLCLKIGSDEHH